MKEEESFLTYTYLRNTQINSCANRVNVTLLFLVADAHSVSVYERFIAAFKIISAKYYSRDPSNIYARHHPRHLITRPLDIYLGGLKRKSSVIPCVARSPWINTFCYGVVNGHN